MCQLILGRDTWFKVVPNDAKPSGFGLAYYDFGNWASTTNVGSRLCFKSVEQAEYAGKQFIDLYEDLMLIDK